MPKNVFFSLEVSLCHRGASGTKSRSEIINWPALNSSLTQQAVLFSDDPTSADEIQTAKNIFCFWTWSHGAHFVRKPWRTSKQSNPLPMHFTFPWRQYLCCSSDGIFGVCLLACREPVVDSLNSAVCSRHWGFVKIRYKMFHLHIPFWTNCSSSAHPYTQADLHCSVLCCTFFFHAFFFSKNLMTSPMVSSKKAPFFSSNPRSTWTQRSTNWWNALGFYPNWTWHVWDWWSMRWFCIDSGFRPASGYLLEAQCWWLSGFVTPDF